MSLVVDFNESWNSQLEKEIEQAIRNCIGDPPENENWVVSVNSGLSSQYCEVQVRTPNQTRTRFFFEEPAKLPKAIADWIGMYPLR